MNSCTAAILGRRGERLFRAESKLTVFTDVPAADALPSDLTHHPRAFDLACVMDRQIRAVRAWLEAEGAKVARRPPADRAGARRRFWTSSLVRRPTGAPGRFIMGDGTRGCGI